MTIFDLEAGGVVSNLEQIEFEPLRRVREVKGLLADLVAEAQANPSDDLICAILLDEGALVEPAAQLRPFYPNILQTLREKKKDLVISTAGRAQSKLDDPVGVISEFVAYVRGEEPSRTEQGVVAELLNEPVREEV
jgi:DNA repair protein SbcD/Mre11